MRIKKLLNWLTDNWTLIVILLIAVFLRLYKLGSIPPHLTSDEASLGYSAYSILKTGRDEYGELLPIIFKSFGDYKPGLYVYMTIPFVTILGLTEFATRLPSAMTGVLAVWLIYKIVLEFITKENGGQQLNIKQLLPKISAFILAISPWHIHFSRGAWEANLSLTLTLAGIYFFLKAIEKPKLLIFSSLFFSSTLLTYQGAKLSTSIVIFILVATFWKEIRKWLNSARRDLVASIILGLIISLPIIASIFQGKTGRLEVFSIFSYPRNTDQLATFLSQGKERVGDVSYYLFHSERLNFARAIAGRWFNHFSGRFLFFEGDYQNPRHSAPNHGMLLISDIILLVFGFIEFIRFRRKLSLFVVLWLILSPLPAVLSRDEVHAIRALNMVIPLTLISSFGLWSIINWIKQTKNTLLHITYYVLLVFVLLSSSIYFLDAYFIHLPKHSSKNWEYGYKQIVEAITPIQNNFEQIKIQQSFAQPYIFFLFYQKYDPSKYQKQASLVESEFKGDVGYVTKLDNICFCAIDWPQNKKEHGALVVADTIRIPDVEIKQTDVVNLVSEIKYLNGEVALRIVEIK